MSSEFTARKTRRCLFLGSGDEKNAKTDSAEFWLTHLKPTPPPNLFWPTQRGGLKSVCFHAFLPFWKMLARMNSQHVCSAKNCQKETNKQRRWMKNQFVFWITLCICDALCDAKNTYFFWLDATKYASQQLQIKYRAQATDRKIPCSKAPCAQWQVLGSKRGTLRTWKHWCTTLTYMSAPKKTLRQCLYTSWMFFGRTNTKQKPNSHDKDGIPANAFFNFESRNPLRRATLFIAELCQAVTVQKCRCQSLDGQCCKQISTVVPFFRTNTVCTDHWIPTCFYCRLLSIKTITHQEQT